MMSMAAPAIFTARTCKRMNSQGRADPAQARGGQGEGDAHPLAATEGQQRAAADATARDP